MREKVVMVTGASGEVGQALIRQLMENDKRRLLTLDLKPLPLNHNGTIIEVQGSILDTSLLDRLVSEYD